MYIRQLDISGSADDRIITIPSQTHTGASLALAIKAGLEAAFGAGTYNAVYNERKGTITITTSQVNTTFMIVTDDWLQDVADWSGASIDTSNLKSINEVLRNTAGIDAATYDHGFLID